MDSKFQSNLEQCNRLMESANANVQQKNFDSAINDYTRIIMFVPNWIENAEKTGVPVEIREIFIAALQSAYAGRAASYLSIGDKEKYDADLAMSQKLSSNKSLPSKNISSSSSSSSGGKFTDKLMAAVIAIVVLLVVLSFMNAHWVTTLLCIAVVVWNIFSD